MGRFFCWFVFLKGLQFFEELNCEDHLRLLLRFIVKKTNVGNAESFSAFD